MKCESAFYSANRTCIHGPASGGEGAPLYPESASKVGIRTENYSVEVITRAGCSKYMRPDAVLGIMAEWLKYQSKSTQMMVVIHRINSVVF